MKRNYLFIILLSILFSTVMDIDGNVYQTIVIGNKIWMASDLKVTHFNNGDEILYACADCYMDGGHGDYIWTSDPDYAGMPKYTYLYSSLYLYNWAAASDNRGLCPVNYHLASPDEWGIMIQSLEVANGTEGGALKDTGTQWWWYPNTGATNSSGFTARAAGLRRYGMFDTNGDGSGDETFASQGEFALYWTSSFSTVRALVYESQGVHTASGINVGDGLSVRCVCNDVVQFGCTDPNACNYNSNATVDDESCWYVDSNQFCDCNNNVFDCYGVCGGTATDLGCGCGENAPDTYYQDNDGDGLGYGNGQDFCEDPGDGWVTNNNDDNDFCDGFIDDCGECNGNNSSCAQATLSFGSIDSESGTVEIFMINAAPIAGFQFIIEDTPNVIDLVEVFEGTSVEYDFVVSSSESGVIIGFSLTGNNIPPGAGNLVIASFDNTNDYDMPINLCLEDAVFSNPSAGMVPVSIGECVEIVFTDNILGDLNNDGTVNIIDVVLLVNIILSNESNAYADVNNDGAINVLDVVQLVNIILGN